MRPLHLIVLVGLLSLAGCAKSAPDAAVTAAAAQSSVVPQQDGSDRQVKLSAEDAGKMGIVVVHATAAQFLLEIQGYAIVVNHDAIAQAVADVGTAEAVSKQSHAALTRMEHLAGTAGAETAEAHEAAQRQASADEIAAALAQRKLSSLLGQHSPWAAQDNQALLQQVASGHTKIVRVTFALGTLKLTPHSLRLSRLDAPTAQEQWYSHTIWNAPADASMPGRSFFALLPDVSVEEGERLNAWAPGEDETAASGAWVPGSAAVAEGGRYWCYVQRQQGTFARTPLDIRHPLRDGYFVSDLKPGDAIVTGGAGLLLARELNPDTEADD